MAARTHRAWLALAGLAAGVVALAVAAALALGRRLARPLERWPPRRGGWARATSPPAPTPTGVSEIDDVGAALNGSSQRIAELVNRERDVQRRCLASAAHAAGRAAPRARGSAPRAASRQRPELTAALTQVDRLQGTIETLLAVVRGTPRGEQRTDLAALIARARGTLARYAGRRGAPSATRVGDVEPAIAAISPAVLDEITEVLMQNAHVHGGGAVT